MFKKNGLVCFKIYDFQILFVCRTTQILIKLQNNYSKNLKNIKTWSSLFQVAPLLKQKYALLK